MPKHYNDTFQKDFGQLLKGESDFFGYLEQYVLDGLWCWDLRNSDEGNINNNLAKSLGYAPEGDGGMTVDFLSLVYEPDREILQNSYKDLMGASGITNFNVELRLIPKNNDPIWFNLKGTLVVDELEGPLRMLGVAYNIHKYKSVELEIRRRKEHFKNVVKGAKIGIWEGNLITGEVVCNERWAGMVGYTLEELAPINYEAFLGLVHPEDAHAVEQALQDHMSNQGIYEVEFRMRHKDGRWIWMLSRGEITNYNSEGLPLTVSGIHYDITKRKTNELLLKKYKDLFERSGEAAKIGYWELDPLNNEIFWNKAVKEIHEVPYDYVPTVDSGLDFYLEGEDRNRFKAVFEQALQQPLEFDEELRIRSKNYGVKWVRVIGVSEHRNGECISLFGLIQDIDQIKKVQLQIKIREEQFRQTFNHSAIGMALVNKENKLLQANDSLSAIFGYSQEELQQMNLEKIAEPNDLKVNRKLIEELFSGKHKYIKLDHRFIHKNGSVIWANVCMSAINNDQGDIIHFVAQIQDITDRKENEMLLAHNVDLMHRINDAVNIGVWELDLTANTVYWSPTIKKMAEVPEDFVPTLEEVYTFFASGQHRETFMEAIEHAMLKGEGFDLELQVVTTITKKVFWSRTIGIPVMEDGKCARLYGFFQDIDEKARATKELAIKEEEFRRSFKHAAIGMLVIDLDGRLKKANPRICEILGYDEKEILGKSILDLAHPKDKDVIRQMLVEIQSGKKGVFKMEQRCIHKSGDYVWVNAGIAAVQNDAGVFTHLVAQVQDISDKKQLTENLTEHNNRLINFAHIVSHNLRSHTSNISMLLNLALQDNPSLIKNDYYRNIKAVSDNMNETIFQLNEIVEINSKVSSTLTSQNLLVNVEKALNTVQSLVNKTNAKVDVDIDSGINVLAVHAYLESIILNLITNAIKYRSPDRNLKIKVLGGLKGSFAYLRIVDNGLGIDLDRYGSKIFGMYKTFHSHPEARGIGLFISKNQIEAMGGSIAVESELNKGTTFTTYFRIAK